METGFCPWVQHKYAMSLCMISEVASWLLLTLRAKRGAEKDLHPFSDAAGNIVTKNEDEG